MEDLKDQFLQNGFVKLPSFFDDEEIDCWAEDLGWLVEVQLKRSGGQKCEESSPVSRLSQNLIALNKLNSDAQGWIYDEVNRRPWIHRLAGDDRLIELAQVVLESKHIGIHPRLNMVMAMPGRDWHLADWHQDAFYGPHNHLVMYVPLQATGAHNGGLCVARGEHKRGLFEHNLGNNSVNSKWLSLNPDYLTNESTFQLELNAGDLLLFSGYLPHSATQNTSGDVRFALTIRYTDLEDDYFINRGWRWQDLAASGLAALQSGNADD